MRHFLRYLLLSLTLLLSVSLFGQSTKWRDIYQTKKKDTLFGIANKYGITVPDLLDVNPDMKTEGYVLKKGTTVFIPFAKPERSANSVKTPATPAKVVTSAKAATPSSAIRVGMMLPLHDVDGDGRRMVEYYRGFLMAVEDMKRQGFSTEVYAWNVPIDADMRQTLLKEGATKCDVIFGPLYSKQVAALGEFCKAYDIKMVIPFSISGNEVNTNRQVYQVYQSAESLNRSAINAYLNRFPNAHPISSIVMIRLRRKGYLLSDSASSWKVVASNTASQISTRRPKLLPRLSTALSRMSLFLIRDVLRC